MAVEFRKEFSVPPMVFADRESEGTVSKNHGRDLIPGTGLREKTAGCGLRASQNISEASGGRISTSLRETMCSPVIISLYGCPGPTIG